MESLRALESAPSEPSRYADAALAYAKTDVPAMTLVWGMTYQAMGGGAREEEVASALSSVLTERIRVSRREQGDGVDFNVRLAPGSMPVRKYPDGSVQAPLAYVYEGLFAATLSGFRPPWNVEEFYDALSTWAGMVSTRGTPLDEHLELNAWLVATAKAGHLEAFCHRLLGPAFPAERKSYIAENKQKWLALQEYSKAGPLRPTRAPMPDDLVRLQ